MKKHIFFVFIFISTIMMLSACNGLNLSKSPATPPEQAGADTDLATRVSKILTVAATQGYKSPTPTPQDTKSNEKEVMTETVQSPTSVPGTVAPATATTGATTTATTAPTATVVPTQQPSPTQIAAATIIPTTVPTLTVVETATVIPTAIANLTPIATTTDDPALRLGAPTSKDPMDNSTLWSWPAESDQYTNIQWANGFMKLTSLTTTAGWRLPVIAPSQDIYLEMNAHSETCSGKDSYGFYFRVNDKTASNGYWFIISCDGYYRLAKWDGNTLPKGTFSSLIDWTFNKNIRKGANQPNRLSVLAKGSTISLFVNGNLLKSITDSTYPSGYFGVFINRRNTNNYTVDIDDIAYWNNPK